MQTTERQSYHHLMQTVDQAKTPMHKRDRIARRYWNAWWYAAGIDDQQGTDYADTFAHAHGMDTFLYESGQSWQLDSIRSAYQSFIR